MIEEMEIHNFTTAEVLSVNIKKFSDITIPDFWPENTVLRQFMLRG